MVLGQELMIFKCELGNYESNGQSHISIDNYALHQSLSPCVLGLEFQVGFVLCNIWFLWLLETWVIYDKIGSETM